MAVVKCHIVYLGSNQVCQCWHGFTIMPDGARSDLTDDIIFMYISVYQFIIGLRYVLTVILGQHICCRDDPQDRVASLYIEAQLHICVVYDCVRIWLVKFSVGIDT